VLLPARGKGRIFKVFDFLSAIQADGHTDLHQATQALVHRHKRRGLCVLISDFYDPDGIEAALSLLIAQGFEPIATQIYDEREAHPTFKGDLEIVDCETGETRAVTVSRKLLTQFAREHELYLHEIERLCMRRAVPYFRASTVVPFDELILRIFRQGG